MNSYLKITIVIAIIVAVFCLGRGCSPEPKQSYSITDTIKKDIQKANIKRDSIKKEIPKHDSVRTEIVIRYKILKEFVYRDCDSILPLIVNVCDSIIKVDSTEIFALKRMVELDEFVIGSQRKVIVNDSLLVKDLKKEVNKLKRQKRRILVGGSLLLGASLIVR